MKATFALLAAPMALAAPTIQSRALPDLTPVHVKGLDIDFDLKCGGTTVKAGQVSKAVQWGVDLQIANQEVGASKYPHYYGNNGNNQKFKFLDPVCNQHPQQLRREMPVPKEGIFKGDGDDDPKKIRAIYVYDSNTPAGADGHPVATYCGTIYHKGNDFEGCDVTKN